jgi:hypothetical protein
MAYQFTAALLFLLAISLSNFAIKSTFMRILFVDFVCGC